MITEKDLQEAIAECEGYRNPNSNTCIKLAAFYIIREHLFPSTRSEESHSFDTGYSYDHKPSYAIETDSDTEFAQAINGRTADEIIPIMNETMDALKILNPRFYASVIRKLNTH